MKIFSQLNKIICLVQKVRFVTNTSLLLLLLSFFSCASQKTEISDDLQLFNHIISNAVDKNLGKTICVDSNTNNNDVISIIEEGKLADERGPAFMNEFYESQAIKNSKDFKDIFNHEEYDYLISQKQDLNWNVTKFEYENVSFCNNTRRVNGCSRSADKTIYISKPIYTKNKKYALVRAANGGGSSYIILFKKNEKTWKEYTFFSFTIS